MPSKGELPVVPDTKENLEVIAERLFSINGDVKLPGRFALSRLKKTVSHLDVFRVNLALADQTTSGCRDAMIVSL